MSEQQQPQPQSQPQPHPHPHPSMVAAVGGCEGASGHEQQPGTSDASSGSVARPGKRARSPSRAHTRGKRSRSDQAAANHPRTRGRRTAHHTFDHRPVQSDDDSLSSSASETPSDSDDASSAQERVGARDREALVGITAHIATTTPLPLPPQPPPPAAAAPVAATIVSAFAAPAAASAVMTQDEFECPVCRCLLCQPVTTGCGHTFCRACLIRATLTVAICPICRRAIHVDTDAKETVILTQAISRAWPDEYQARLSELDPSDDAVHQTELPLLVLPAILFPGMVMPLHLFEATDRLILKRALEASGSFAVVPQEYGDIGTAAVITSHVAIADGRSLVSTRGDRRLRVLATRIDADGCPIATVSYIDDQLQASAAEFDSETAQMIDMVSAVIDANPAAPPNEAAIYQSLRSLFDTAPTIDALFEHLKARIKQKSGPALMVVEQKFGRLPATDPVALSFWVASLLPVPLKQKQELLRQNSTRLRLARALLLSK